MNKKELEKFVEEIIEIYDAGKIRAPVHLSGGREGKQAENLIEIFKRYKKGDWIFSTWRSHYHWLLSGRDPKELKEQIVNGHSMHVYGDRFFTSAIVGGISPIALGVAWSLKLKGNPNGNMVWCFLGDAGYNCGLTLECIKYAMGFNLPILYVIEENGLSVNAETRKTWGEGRNPKVLIYKYKRKYTHAGSGLEGGPKKYVMF